MIDGLIEVVIRIWRADTEMRESSVVGESDMDRTSRKMVAWICGGLISLLVVGGLIWVWFVEVGID
jgi:hypothetical protein